MATAIFSTPKLPSKPLLRFLSTITIDPEVKRLTKSGHLADLEALLESRKNSPAIADDSFAASLIASYAYASLLPAADRTFHSLPDTSRSAVSLNALLHSYNQASLFSRVPDLFKSLSEKYSIEPDFVSYGILIRALCAGGGPEKAFPVLKEMEEKSVEVTAVTYTPIIDALYKKKKDKEAEEVWEEMIGRGCVPDVTAYNVKANHAARNGRIKDVKRVFEEMERDGLEKSVVSYNLLITCYCKCGMYSEAKKVYASLEENGVVGSASTYRNFMYLLCKAGEVEAAFEVCKDGIRSGKIPDIGPLVVLLKSLVKESREKDVRWLIEKVKGKFSPGQLREWEKMQDKIGLSVE